MKRMLANWIRRLFCDHEWRKTLPLVVLGSGEPLTTATHWCCKCHASKTEATRP